MIQYKLEIARMHCKSVLTLPSVGLRAGTGGDGSAGEPHRLCVAGGQDLLRAHSSTTCRPSSSSPTCTVSFCPSAPVLVLVSHMHTHAYTYTHIHTHIHTHTHTNTHTHTHTNTHTHTQTHTHTHTHTHTRRLQRLEPDRGMPRHLRRGGFEPGTGLAGCWQNAPHRTDQVVHGGCIDELINEWLID